MECLRCFAYQLGLFSDINECSAASSDCDVNAYCQNTQGSYSCSCKAGFTGDGKACTAGKRSIKLEFGEGLELSREDIRIFMVDFRVTTSVTSSSSGYFLSHRYFIECVLSDLRHSCLVSRSYKISEFKLLFLCSL